MKKARKQSAVRRSVPNGPRHVSTEKVHGLVSGAKYAESFPLNVSTIGTDEPRDAASPGWFSNSRRSPQLGMKGSKASRPASSPVRRASEFERSAERSESPPERRRIQSARGRDPARESQPLYLDGQPHEIFVHSRSPDTRKKTLELDDSENDPQMAEHGALSLQIHQPMVRVPSLVLTPRFPSVASEGSKAFQPESRRPLSARIAAAAYVHKDSRIENIMSKEIAPKPNAEGWAKKTPRQSIKDEDTKRREKSMYETASEGHDIAVGKRPELPEDLQNLSIVAKLEETRKRLAEEARPQNDTVIGVRKPGYNPLLLKYDQPMPLKDAKYLALGHSEDVIAVQTYLTPRPPPGRRDSATTASKEKPDEITRKVVAHASARISELAKPVPKVPGRNEPQRSSGWFLRSPRVVVYKDHIENNTKNLERFRPELHLAALAERNRKHQEQVLAKHKQAEARAQERRNRLLRKREGAQGPSASLSARELSDEAAKRRLTALRMGWLRVIFAVKYVQSAKYILEVNRDPFAEAEGASANYYASSFAQNVATQMQQKQISTFLVENNLRDKTHVLAAIRWVFDNRREGWEGARKSAPIARFLLRHHVRRVRSRYDKAADAIAATLQQKGQTKSVIQAIRRYFEKIVSCQRFLRRSVIRARKRAGQVSRRWEELQAVLVLREMQAAVQAHIAGIGERMHHVLTITGAKDLPRMRVSEERRWTLERIFPGLPLWVAAVLDKISAEMIRVLSQHYSLGAKPSDVWTLMLRVYTQARLPRHINGALTREIRAEFNRKSQLMWHDYLVQRKTRRLKEEQDDFIVQALNSWGGDARALFEREKKDRKVEVRIKKPEWPIAHLNEHFAAECYKQGLGILATELGERQPTTQERVVAEINGLLSHTQDSTVQIGAAIEARSNAPTLPTRPAARPNKPPSSVGFNLKPQPAPGESSALRRSGVMFADDGNSRTPSNSTAASLRRSGDMSSGVRRSGDFTPSNRRSTAASRKSGFFQPIPG